MLSNLLALLFLLKLVKKSLSFVPKIFFIVPKECCRGLITYYRKQYTLMLNRINSAMNTVTQYNCKTFKQIKDLLLFEGDVDAIL